jgi:hypothetical protein
MLVHSRQRQAFGHCFPSVAIGFAAIVAFYVEVFGDLFQMPLDAAQVPLITSCRKLLLQLGCGDLRSLGMRCSNSMVRCTVSILSRLCVIGFLRDVFKRLLLFATNASCCC